MRDHREKTSAIASTLSSVRPMRKMFALAALLAASVLGSCTTGGGTFAIQAANSVPKQTTVTISASSGAAAEATELMFASVVTVASL